MSWQDRLRPQIQLKSPEQNDFVALWRSSPRTKTKKLGVFSFPNVKGSIVQDLDVNSDTYSMTLYFDGPDNDVEAERFWQSANENGVWEMLHPTKGTLFLQLVDITENIDPITSGNITAFDTNWIEPIADDNVRSIQEISNEVKSLSDEVNVNSAEQLLNNIKQATAKATQAVENATNVITTAVDSVLRPLAELQAEVLSLFDSIQRGIQDTISAPVIDMLTLAGQMQQLIQTPLLAVDDVEARLDLYVSLASDLLLVTDDDATPSPDLKNEVSIKEISQIAVITSIALISTSNSLLTRSQSLNSIDQINEIFILITDNLDVIQQLFDSLDIDNQYFSQSQSFNNSARLIALAVFYLLNNLYSLAIEKVFILQVPRSPIALTIQEYGDLGENDSNLDFFIDTNKLKADEILLLKSGKEVVVYV